MKHKYKKSCPQCENEMIYNSFYSFNYSVEKNVICSICRNKRRKLERNCPQCNYIITYSTKNACYTANKKQSLCKKCAMNKSEKIYNARIKMMGKNNPFYGKTHTKESLEKMSVSSKNKWKTKTPEERELDKTRFINRGNKNGMYGKSVYQRWIELYGKEEADKRLSESNRKKSINGRGKQSGRSPHHCCGRGWKGKYKGHYFRSLGELSYMIYLDENHIEWKTAETKEYTIKYINEEGLRATYKPDFIINNHKLIEIKPKALQKTNLNQLKFNAAIEFCKNNNLEYEVINMDIDLIKIKIALDNKLIQFSKDFEIKFLDFYNKKYN